MNDAVLTAGFLAAITNFSNELKSGGTNLTLRSQGIYFTLEKNGQFLYALQSLNYIKQIEIRFHEFIKIAKIEKFPGGELKKEHLEPIKVTLRESFKSLY